MAKTKAASHIIGLHEETCKGFVKDTISLSVIAGFIFFALYTFSFITSHAILTGLTGFGTLGFSAIVPDYIVLGAISFGYIVLGAISFGYIVTFMDASARSKKWIFSLGTLVAYGLLVAAMIT